MQVVVRGPLRDVILVDAFRATPPERARSMTAHEAAFWIHTVDRRGLDARLLADLGPALPVRGPEDVRDRLADALDRGCLLAVPRERRGVVQRFVEDDEPVLGPDTTATERVDFVFDFMDGTAVRDVGYVLEDPGGGKTPGKLPGDGTVSRAPASGNYSVSLKEIDDLAFRPSYARPADEVTVEASATGLPDGAPGTLRIYRLYSEDPADALATVTATLADGRARATWKLDPARTGGPPDADGLAYYVAELSFEDGAVWRKTEPLTMELPALVDADWSTPSVGPGEETSLVVEATGFDDGASVTVTLFRHDPWAGDEKLGDAPPAVLRDGTAIVALQVGAAPMPSRACDVVAHAKVEGGGAHVEGTSGVLRVHAVIADGVDAAA